MILSFRTSSYARDIYLYGNRTFADVPAEYHEPIKVYAVNTFTQEQIDNALTQGWITQEQYDQTMTYKAA